MDREVTVAVMPLNSCTREAIEPGRHAMVYGRVRIWYHGLGDNHDVMKFHWSKYAWWKAMWYPHVGPPHISASWGVYAGDSTSHTGPRDAELTHWAPMLPAPDDGRGDGH